MREQTPHFVGLDIGTSTVRCVVGIVDQQDGTKVSVIGHGVAQNLGMRKGVVAHIDDVTDAIHQMSLYLVSDFGYEMRDVAGTPEDIFYLFIGSPVVLSPAEVEERLKQITLSVSDSETIDLLLWYGFLGIVDRTGNPVFIYDRAYDFRRLEAERRSRGSELMYALNPAFLSGLN